MQIIELHRNLHRDFDLLFLDTEFTRLPLPTESSTQWLRRVEILSVGLVAVDQSIKPFEFYAVRQITKPIKNKCSSFVVREVLPLLDRAEPGHRFVGALQLKRLIAAFLKQRLAHSKIRPAIAVDWAGDLLIIQPALSSDAIGVSLEGMIALDDVAMSSGALRHHALHDARQLRQQFLSRTAAE